MENWNVILGSLSSLASVITVLVLLIKPIRERLFGQTQIKEGQKCLLRSDMLRIYYRNRDTKTIRQYEYENFKCEYAAYKALKGNSFINHINEEIETWSIIQ